MEKRSHERILLKKYVMDSLDTVQEKLHYLMEA